MADLGPENEELRRVGLVECLAQVQARARSLPWAKERPWRVNTHLWVEGGVPVVDLHDLNAGAARLAVKELVKLQPTIGAVIFVVGRGKHSRGSPVLGKVVSKVLRKACRDEPVWTFRSLHQGRIAWIINPALAPNWVTGRMGIGCWLLGLGFGAAVVMAALQIAKDLF